MGLRRNTSAAHLSFSDSLRAPEMMKQHGKLAGYRNDSLTSGLLATSGG
jgi:hypothetical protein